MPDYLGGLPRNPVSHSVSVVASDGVALPIDSLAQTIGRDGSSNPTTVTVVYLGNTYVKTNTFTGTTQNTSGPWIKQ